MKSLASLALLLLVAAQEPPPGDGPRGSSQRAAGEVRYDAVGYATRGALPGVSVAARDLPPGSYAEVTALDSGKTIVAAVSGDDASMIGLAMLSPSAADALGVGDRAAVRIRKVVPTPQDMVQLRDGGAASFRADAPPALLVALRKQLPAPTDRIAVKPRPVVAKPRPAARPPMPRPTPVAAPESASAAAGGYIVQVAALSSAARADVVARAVGGSVIADPPVWRVRLGPYGDPATAARAKVDAARKGYPGGQITRLR